MTLDHSILKTYGWNDKIDSHYKEFSAYFGEKYQVHYKPARVLAVDRNGCVIATEKGIVRGIVSRMITHGMGENLEAEKYNLISPLRKPATGDWVVYLEKGEACLIRAVLPRASKFARNAAGSIVAEEQVLTANIDYACIVTAMNRDMSLSRIERYLAAIYDSGCLPIIVLNKADLCEKRDGLFNDILAIAWGAPVIMTSALTGEGIEELMDHMLPGKTYAFFGSSGVGKSSLLNQLKSDAHAAVREISAYSDRGVHTTTRREMYLLENGSLVIDTPGMRAVQLWADGATVDGLFEDILELARLCRFSNCTHTGEPGCAVREAIDEGSLTEKRLSNYYKMQRELEYIKRKEHIKRDRKKKIKYSRKRKTVDLE